MSYFVFLPNLKIIKKNKLPISTQQKSSKFHWLHLTVNRPLNGCRVASLPTPDSLWSLTAVREGPLDVHRAPVKEAL